MSEKYIPGYSLNAINFMAKRQADSHASFFKPYLKPGIKLLDCGCGPGTITFGLASWINPGLVTAIDLEQSQVDIASKSAAELGINNVEFLRGSIYEIPLPENTFDVAFSHALLEHLQEPVLGLKEILRVLKPGGIAGVRTPDWGGFLIRPSNPELVRAIEYYKMLQERNGGNPYVGGELPGLFRMAGFSNIRFSATYECYEKLGSIAEYLALRIESSGESDRAIEKGLVDSQESLNSMANALREWSQHPDGIFAQTWCEAVGEKPKLA
ncbi:MAG: methyltransferase domain-containing protein [Okeania sp. SIO2H7]|nr:methyltransferase domain-containing protein [Okeania sp. SIO2H7]